MNLTTEKQVNNDHESSLVSSLENSLSFEAVRDGTITKRVSLTHFDLNLFSKVSQIYLYLCVYTGQHKHFQR